MVSVSESLWTLKKAKHTHQRNGFKSAGSELIYHCIQRGYTANMNDSMMDFNIIQKISESVKLPFSRLSGFSARGTSARSNNTQTATCYGCGSHWVRSTSSLEGEVEVELTETARGWVGLWVGHIAISTNENSDRFSQMNG